MHLNTGRALQRPYESRYSIFRRFLISNPTLLTSSLYQNMRNTGHSKYNTFIDDILIKNRIPIEPVPEYLYMSYPFNTRSYDKQCSICAQQCYHSDIFQIPWITHCPIHHKRLVTHCPVCNQTWPDYMEIIKRDCPGCGKKIKYDMLPKHTTFANSSLYDPIIKLVDFILYKNKESNEGELTCSYSNFTGRRIWPHICDPYFPSYQLQRYPVINENYLKKIGIPILQICSKRFRIHQYKKKETTHNQKHITSTCSWISNERYKVLLSIVENIKKVTPKTHQLEIFDFSNLTTWEFRELLPLCPYCVAFSIWFYRITGAPEIYLHSGNNPLSQLTDKSAFNDPYTPVPMDKLLYNNFIFKTSLNFKKMIYKRDLHASFIHIFNDTYTILQNLNYDILHHEFKTTSLLPRIKIYLDKTTFYNINMEKNEICAYYPSNKLLDSDTIRLPKRATTSCKRFKNKIIDKHLRDHLKRDNPSLPDCNGLNEQEYLILKNVELEYYNRYERGKRLA